MNESDNLELELQMLESGPEPNMERSFESIAGKGFPKIPKSIAGIDFAPVPAGKSFWPVASSHPTGKIVSYVANDDTVVGNKSRAFHALRNTKMKNGSVLSRFHMGIDIYANANDPVVACEDGTIVNFYKFYGNTYAIIVKHQNVVINYGEVRSDSLSKNGLKKGSQVKAGQNIGYIGITPGGSSMLHFETYKPGTIANKRRAKGEPPPKEILNPTSYLLFLKYLW